MSNDILSREEGQSNEIVPLSLSKKQKNSASVKYSNKFNRTSLGNLNATELNILHAILVELKKFVDLNEIERMRTELSVSISFDEIYQLCSLVKKHSSSNELFTVISDFAKKAMAQMFEVQDPDTQQTTWTHFFSSITFDDNLKKLFIKMDSTLFKELLVEFSTGYTQFSFIGFLSIKSKYSKLIYMILNQYKFTGWAELTLEQLKRILEIPASYSYSDIKKQILDKAIIDLNQPMDLMDICVSRTQFSNLSYTPIYADRGSTRKGRKSVARIRFTFDKLEKDQIPDAVKKLV